MLVAIGGHSRNIGKTSVICGFVRALPDWNWTAIKVTPHRHVVCPHDGEASTDTDRFLAAGADPADADQRVILGLQPTGDEALAAVSSDDFRRAFTRSFGQRNPDRMDFPFWQAMIRSGVSAYEGGRRFQEEGRILKDRRMSRLLR